METISSLLTALDSTTRPKATNIFSRPSAAGYRNRTDFYLPSDQTRNTIYLRRFKKKVTLSGIIYVHRITDARVDGPIQRNLRMLGELYGDSSAKNVVLVTTMWDKARSEEEASQREDSLKTRYWNVLLYHRASVARFYNDQDSAWKIIDQVTGRDVGDRIAVSLQEEMVTLGQNLNETSEGKALYRDLQGLLDKQSRTMQSLAEKAEGAQTHEDVDAEMNRLREEIETLLKEVEGLKIPLGQRLALFFGRILGRKSQAVIQHYVHALATH